MALFVHGVVLNKHVWRRQSTGLSDTRRCIAVDLLANGDRHRPKSRRFSRRQRQHAERGLGALKIDKIDLVGNDSGDAIAQIFSVESRSRAEFDARQL